MFNINEFTQEISINRGDTGIFPVVLNCGTDLYPLQYTLKEHDKLYLAIEKPNEPFENAIVKKVISRQNSLFDKDGNVLIKLNSEDTIALMPGLYYYEIKLRKFSQNQFRNFYTIITLNEDNTYQIVDTENVECISSGTYIESNNLITFNPIDSETFYGEFSFDNSINNYVITIDNTIYEREEDFISTVVSQKKFIVER